MELEIPLAQTSDGVAALVGDAGINLDEVDARRELPDGGGELALRRHQQQRGAKGGATDNGDTIEPFSSKSPRSSTNG